MEPLTALSLFCNIVDICDHAIKVCKAAREIYKSATGRRAQDEELLRHVGELQEILNSLRLSSSKLNTGNLYKSIVEPLDRMEAKSAAVRESLDSFRTKRPGSRLSAMAATAKLVVGQGKLDRTLQELKHCRDDVHFAIAQSTRVQIAAVSTQIDRLDVGQHEIQSFLIDLQTRLQSLDNGVSEVPDIVRKAKNISEEMPTTLCALAILCRLGTTNQRFWDVTEADSHTFHWILRNEDDRSLSSHDGEQELKRGGEGATSAWEKRERLEYENTQRDVNAQFRTWLLDGSGLFHISGKPGSGKSTLMKYLVKHPKVIESLEQWAHPKRLALGKFFFWKPDHGQNSLDALIRGLLYSLIHYDAGLVHSAFPKCSGNSFEQLSLQSRVEMTKEDIFEAFDNLSRDWNMSKPFKLCFFIDGLDELDEEKDTTYWKIITVLQQWADGANDSMKICVSSRHFPVFENMPVDHRIRLQDLTKYDIINFVENSLRLHHVLRSEMSVDNEGCQGLIRAISDRADGVFLWVSLVVKSVERGLSNGDPISVLLERVKITPLELEKLFKSLLDSIEDCHAQMAVLLLALALARSPDSRRTRGSDLSLSGCRQFFRAMETSRPIGDTFHFDNVPEAFELTPQILESTKSRLLFRCKGLFDIVSREESSLDCEDAYVGGRVIFIHRSISEFLKTWIPEHMNALEVSSLHVKNALCWMLWAEVDFLNTAIDPTHFSVSGQTWARFYIRKTARATLANFGTDTTFTPELSTAFRLLDLAEDALLMPTASLSTENQTMNNGKSGGCTWNTIWIDASGTPHESEIGCPLMAGPLLAAAYTGCHAYVRWKTTKTLPSAQRAKNFQHCLQVAVDPVFPPLGQPFSGWVGHCMRTVEPLIRTSSADINGTFLNCCNMSIRTGAPTSFFDTMWIIGLSHHSYTDASFRHDFFQLVESLLRLGAISQSVLCVGTARDWFTISPALPDGPLGIQSDSILQIPGSGIRIMSGKTTSERLRMICGQKDGIITLEILVAHAKPPNMAAILSLIERNWHNEDINYADTRELNPTERLQAAVLKKHGLRGTCKLVWFERFTFDGEKWILLE